MKSIMYSDFLKFDPCYLHNPTMKPVMEDIAARKDAWTAIDILELEDIPYEDRLWAVLREELIDPQTLHAFACVCAERIVEREAKPSPGNVAAINAKRAWLRGEITEEKLVYESSYASFQIQCATDTNPRMSAWKTSTHAARNAALCAVRSALKKGASTCDVARVYDIGWVRECAWQAGMLMNMLKEGEG